jgi:ribonuclease BN (tRNA processing enzyme)
LIRNAIAYGRARGDGRIDVIGPSGWRAWFDAAVPDRDATERAFHCVEVPDRGSFTLGDITMVAFAVRHPVPTIGCRLSAEGVELAFSADSGPCPALLELCARVDLFLCEAFLSGPSAETSNIVMTPEQAGAAAELADGIVVGSRAIEVADDGPQALREYVASLRRAVDAAVPA